MKQVSWLVICSPVWLSDVHQALILAREDPSYAEIFRASRAIMFMGTPHRGSDIATAAVRLAALTNLGITVSGASFFVSPIRTDLLKTLARESPILGSIQDSFRHLVKNLIIISCYETEVIDGLQQLVSYDRS